MSLLSGTSSTRYDCVKDVLFDLREAEQNPQIFLKPLILDGFLARGRLQIPSGAFYGRQSEKSMLLHIFSSVTMVGQQPMIASISGYPGTG